MHKYIVNFDIYYAWKVNIYLINCICVKAQTQCLPLATAGLMLHNLVVH